MKPDQSKKGKSLTWIDFSYTLGTKYKIACTSFSFRQTAKIFMKDRDPASFEKLLSLMNVLRSEKGCPWDREQTRQSLKPFMIEETYEVLEAIDHGETGPIMEELGDLLFQVVFHAQIAQELGEFSMEDIIQTLSQKMVRRHPHVFGQVKATTSQEVLVNWEAIKRKENKGSSRRRSVLEGVPALLPALLSAYRLQEKASRVGFDWEEINQVIDKVKEECKELRQAIEEKDKDRQDQEFGDLFFALVNLARFLDIHPEEALRKTNRRFTQRFQHVEQRLAEQGKDPQEASLTEMDALWEEAKREEKTEKTNRPTRSLDDES
jgi:tetrapyrrole methylase family protein/MazG family protein